MMRALCYGGTVADKRPIFQPIIMWVVVILSALLYVSSEKPEQSYILYVCLCVCVSQVCRIFPLTLSDRRVWCFVVLQCVGCGHHAAVKVISYSFSPDVSPHIPCPQHVSGSRVGPRVLRDQTSLSSPGPLCLFIHQLCLCLRLCGCVGS